MIGIHPPIHEPPERVARTCPLGIRFLDMGTNSLVDSDVRVGSLERDSWGLHALAFPLGAPQRKTIGVGTPSGIIAFHGLPGLREFENSPADDPWALAPPQREFQIEVADAQGRFLPCRFVVRAPEPGLVDFGENDSPPWIETGAVPLFSAPGRTPPPNVATVRAELHELASDGPAAWAMFEASYSSAGIRRTARGLADNAGRVLLTFPYPEGQRSGSNQSPPAGARGFAEQEWPIDFAVYYGPAPERETADYGRCLSQPSAVAWRGFSPITALGEETLRFGRELDLGRIDVAPA
jgi:hypothetical protein